MLTTVETLKTVQDFNDRLSRHIEEDRRGLVKRNFDGLDQGCKEDLERLYVQRRIVWEQRAKIQDAVDFILECGVKERKVTQRWQK
jgi:hypothetical protein